MLSVNIFPVKFLDEVHPSIFCHIKKIVPYDSTYRTRTNFQGTYILRMPQILSAFSRFYFRGSQDFVLVDYLRTITNFEDLIFVDHTSAKTAKFTSLENLYEYSTSMVLVPSNSIYIFWAQLVLVPYGRKFSKENIFNI